MPTYLYDYFFLYTCFAFRFVIILWNLVIPGVSDERVAAVAVSRCDVNMPAPTRLSASDARRLERSV